MYKLLPYEEKQLHGYIDQKGKLVIPCKWEDANPFENGQASSLRGNV